MMRLGRSKEGDFTGRRLGILGFQYVVGDPGVTPPTFGSDRLQWETWMPMKRNLVRVPRIRLVADYIAGIVTPRRIQARQRPWLSAADQIIGL